MIGTNGVKKVNRQVEIVRELTEKLKTIEDESNAKIKKSVSDLEFSHALEVQRLQGEGEQREKNILKDFKLESQAQTKVLVMALLRTKFERDRLILAVSWAAIAIVTIVAWRSGIHDSLSKGFTFAALAGFFGSIIFVRQSLKRNSKYWESIQAGTMLSDPIWEEADVKPTVFMLLGSISALLLGLPMFLNTTGKDVYLPQSAQLTGYQASSVKAADVTKTEMSALPAAAALAASLPVENNKEWSSAAAVNSDNISIKKNTVKKIGNGGNFAGGFFQ